MSPGFVDIHFTVIWVSGYAVCCHLDLWICSFLSSGFVDMCFTDIGLVDMRFTDIGLVDMCFTVMWVCGYAFYCHLGLWICGLLSSGFVNMRFTLIWTCGYAFFCHLGLTPGVLVNTYYTTV